MTPGFDVTDANWNAMGRIIQPLNGLHATLLSVHDELGLLLEPTEPDKELARDAVDAWQQLDQIARQAVATSGRAQRFAVAQIRKSGPVPYGDGPRENWIVEQEPYAGAKLVKDRPGRRKPTAH